MKKIQWAVGLVCGFLNGLFGSGGGTALVPAMEKFLKLEEHRAHATALSVIVPMSVLSLGIYLMKASVPLDTALWAIAGGIPGGIVGAKALARTKGRLLHLIFGLMMLLAAGRMWLR